MRTALPTATESVASAAERHHVCAKTIRRKIASGDLTAYRLGSRLIRLDPAEVDALLRPIPNARSVA